MVKLTKMVAYQAKSDLLALLRPDYAPALIGIGTGHFALRYVRRSEIKAEANAIPPIPAHTLDMRSALTLVF